MVITSNDLLPYILSCSLFLTLCSLLFYLIKYTYSQLLRTIPVFR